MQDEGVDSDTAYAQAEAALEAHEKVANRLRVALAAEAAWGMDTDDEVILEAVQVIVNAYEDLPADRFAKYVLDMNGPTAWGRSLVRGIDADARKRSVKSKRIAKAKREAEQGDGDVCLRCGGLGHIDAYRHINGGECFDCGGRGGVR